MTIGSIGSAATYATKARMTGLSSGLDTDSMVKDMVKLEQYKVDNTFRDITKSEWKKQAYTDLVSKSKAFRERFMSALSSENLWSSKVYSGYDNSLVKNKFVSVAANSSSALGSHNITGATLATSATVSGGVVGRDGLSSRFSAVGKAGTDALNTSDTLGSLAGNIFSGTSEEAIISINGQRFTLNKTDSIQKTMDDINNAFSGDPSRQITMSYDDTEKRFIIQNSADNKRNLELSNIKGEFFSESGPIGIATYTPGISQLDTLERAAEKMGKSLGLDEEGNFKFKINDKTFSFSKDTKISDMINTVNSDGSAGVTMSFSQLTDKFTFKSTSTGDSAFLTVSNDGGNAFGNGGFFGVADDDTGVAKSGTNASLTIDGEIISQSSNVFNVDGMRITVSSDYDSAVDTGVDLSFEVKQNVGDIVTKMKSFVEEYNKLVDTFEGKISETKNYKVAVLNQAEREALSKEDLEKWDEKAKSGILKNDSHAKKLMADMREALYSVVEGTGLSPAEIGLSTGAWNEKGKIRFNEIAFKEAVEKNPDLVGNMMSRTETEKDSPKNGFVTKVYNAITDFEKTINKEVLTAQKKELSDYQRKMDDQLANMYRIQENYYKRFAQMEKLMSKYNSQSNWMSSQLSSR